MTGRLDLAIVGDALLDRDLLGRVDRVSPDAPVPVVEVAGERRRPGGAGLAAWLAARDGARVALLTELDGGPAARSFEALLAAAGVEVLSWRRAAPIAEKVRVRVDGQSLVRLDGGTAAAPADGPCADGVADVLRAAGAVLVADYGGGAAARDDVRRHLAEAAASTPLVWDPHPRGSEPVPGAAVATPNRAEVRRFAGAEGDGLDATLRAARALRDRWRLDALCVTLGARGAALVRGAGAEVVPAPGVEAKDVCGAGDRFAAALGLGLGDGLAIDDAARRAVEAASAYVAEGDGWPSAPAPVDGVPAVTSAAGPVREPVVVATSGCFDLLHAGHVRLLTAARSLGDRLVVCLNDDGSVRRLKGAGRPIVPVEERAEVLTGLACVDEVVVFGEDTPERVLERIRPAIFAKGADYRADELPERRVLERWGGEVVILPYAEGRSTTDLIARSSRSRRLSAVGP